MVRITGQRRPDRGTVSADQAPTAIIGRPHMTEPSPLFRDSSGHRLLAVSPKTVNRSEECREHHGVDPNVFAKLLTHHKWELGDIGLALFVSHRHDTDVFPVLGEGIFEGQRARRIFLWRQIVDGDGI